MWIDPDKLGIGGANPKQSDETEKPTAALKTQFQ
jgi:hypothetical protein